MHAWQQIYQYNVEHVLVVLGLHRTGKREIVHSFYNVAQSLLRPSPLGKPPRLSWLEHFGRGRLARRHDHDVVAVLRDRVNPPVRSCEASLPLVVYVLKAFADEAYFRRTSVAVLPRPRVNPQHGTMVGWHCVRFRLCARGVGAARERGNAKSEERLTRVDAPVDTAQHSTLPLVPAAVDGAESRRLVPLGVDAEYSRRVARHSVDATVGTVRAAKPCTVFDHVRQRRREVAKRQTAQSRRLTLVT